MATSASCERWSIWVRRRSCGLAQLTLWSKEAPTPRLGAQALELLRQSFLEQRLAPALERKLARGAAIEVQQIEA
jgi:hypothetical protein